ncbi:hypothetical protein P0Y35_17820 [Kiritimatiellaeota bacterium B1221]|nr:hypothetical protein [Kiritimatiellaeota bacterium B1221]
MKTFYTLSTLLPASLFAHSGHPGPEAHGDATHLLIGLAIALPIALFAFTAGVRSRKKAAVKIRKQD